MTTILWITGASSGIGAAFAELAADRTGEVVTFSRRPAQVGRWVSADLSDPASWQEVTGELGRGLHRPEVDHAVLFHCAGTGEPAGHLVDVDSTAYRRSVTLNLASGPVIGQGFLQACRAAGVRATLLLCGSPAADKVPPGLSHYSAGKAALHHWARCAAVKLEGTGSRVVTVVPYAVETALVHGILRGDPERVPLAGYFRAVQARNGFATPEETARQIWDALEEAPNGAFVPVGAAPAGAPT